jgi:hypothetical protein
VVVEVDQMALELQVVLEAVQEVMQASLVVLVQPIKVTLAVRRQQQTDSVAVAVLVQ